MAKEQTLTIIKPDSTEKRLIGKITTILEENGFEIIAMRRMMLTEEQAKAFYIEHKDKPFYNSLVAYMTSGPVVVAVLEREGAISGLREVMGATNPAEAAEGTIRKLYGTSIERNSIHGSANPADAAREVRFFFSESELI
ncbi:MAG TPA: nucleoside-diphosphate kinase [Acidobacteriota bacterium]|nr:nucleoside-diphosphate kinase [Acidobacteriota bacterium]